MVHDQRSSALRKYQLLYVGGTGLWPLVRYELLTWLVNDLPGLTGFFLRRHLYHTIFGGLGRGVILGRGMLLRQPGRIRVGDRTVIDDYCALTVRGEESGITIGSHVFIGRGTQIHARGGQVEIEDHANLSSYVRVGAATRRIVIGRHALIAASCCIGGVLHRTDRRDVPIAHQGTLDRGGVVIEDDVWLGAGAIVLDGVTVGRGCVVGAGSVVTKDIPPFSVAYGVPARVVRQR